MLRAPAGKGGTQGLYTQIPLAKGSHVTKPYIPGQGYDSTRGWALPGEIANISDV